MIDHSSALYIFITAYIAGLIYPYATRERAQVIAVTSPYRPLALLLVGLHCLSYFGIKLLPVFGTWANVFYISALWLIAFEINANKDAAVKQVVRRTVLLVGIVAGLVFLARASFQDPRSYAYTVIGVSAAAELAIIIAAMRERQTSPSHYLGHAILAASAALGIMAWRVLEIQALPQFTMGAGKESDLLFLLRLLNAVSFFILLSALTNFHFQKLWRSESLRRKATEEGMLKALNALARARDDETGNHILRTQNYVRQLAQNLAAKGWFAQPDVTRHIDMLFTVAPLHDIGKVGIADHVLLKPGKLNAAEWEIMKTHASIGEAVLDAAMQDHGPDTEGAELLRLAKDIAGSHHEHWDGGGYPRGLAGEAIPASARLMSVADIYDALISGRPYKSPWTHEAAVAEIARLSGTHLDPDVVAAFLEEQEAFRAIAHKYADDDPPRAG